MSRAMISEIMWMSHRVEVGCNMIQAYSKVLRNQS